MVHELVRYMKSMNMHGEKIKVIMTMHCDNHSDETLRIASV